MKHRVYGIGLLLCSLSSIIEAQSNFVSLASSCNNTDGSKVTAASISASGLCGVRFYSQSSYAGASSTVYLGFAVNFAVPQSAQLRVVVPSSSAYQLGAGGTSSVVGLTTSGGDIGDVPLHGTGSPTLTAITGGFQVVLGANRTATVLDSKAGFEMLVTNVRNPWKNLGDSATVSLWSNGTEFFSVAVPLVQFAPYTMTNANVSIGLSNNDAMVVTDVVVTLSTSGFLPPDGKLEFHFPEGFRVQKGVTKALNQNKFSEGQAVFVSLVDETSNVVTLKVAPNLGYINTGLSALQGASFLLTSIRNPFAGTTSTFMVRTMTGDGTLIDSGNISGVFVKGGSLTCKVSSGSDRARQLATYEFEIRTVGTIPRDGKFVIIFPFGIHICLDNLNLTSDILGNLGTFTFGVSGIVNPGAGSTNSFTIRTTFFDPTRIIDDSSVPGVSITTSVFPTRGITYSNLLSGQQLLISVNFSTVGYVPDNAIIHVGMPDGFGINLPTSSYIFSSTCCDGPTCFTCNITLYMVQGQDLYLRLFGSGATNLPEGLRISFTLANVRNLWAGPKNGIDIALLLSDQISIISQAIDVDSTSILPGSFNPSLLLQFFRGSDSSLLEPPAAGVCGFYRARINISGTLPPKAVIELRFPPGVQVNDLDCSATPSSPSSVSQVRAIRPASMGLLSSDTASRRVVFQILQNVWSDSWAEPNVLEFDILNVRHIAGGLLDNFSIIAYREDGASVVEQNLTIPGKNVTVNSFASISITPQDPSAGVRSQLTFSFQSPAVMPSSFLLELQIPGSFLMDDGDLTQILSPTVGGGSRSMAILSKNVGNGTMSILVQGSTGLVGGIASSSASCSPAGQSCVRTPTSFPAELLIPSGTQFSFVLDNIRNLAGGFSGIFTMIARENAQSPAIAQKLDVGGPVLVVGQLKDAQVTLKDLGSSMITTANVTLVINNTFALIGAVRVVLPPGFLISAGGTTSVSSPSITRLSLTYPTTAVILSLDQGARMVEVRLSSPGIEFLSSSDVIQFFLSHIQNSIARPAAAGGGYQVTSTFLVLTLLSSGELVETRNAPGALIVPNTISSFPAGAGRLFPASLVPGYLGLLFLQFSLNVELPAGSTIELSLPSSFLLSDSQVSFEAAGYRDASMSYTTASSGGFIVLSMQRKVNAQVISSGSLVRVNVSNARSPTSEGLTGVASLRVLSSDGGVLGIAVLPPNNIGRPSEPRNVEVKNCPADYPQTNPFCLSISFEQPLDDGGSPIVSYMISFSMAADFSTVETLTIDAGGHPGVISVTTRSLNKNVFYVRVQAANGPNASSYGIAGEGNSVRIIDYPGAPRPGLLRPGSANVLSASWLPPQYTGGVNPVARLLGYKIEFDKSSSSFLQVNPNQTLVLDASQTVASSGFLPTGFYFARIFAKNDIGYGPPAVFASSALATPFLPVQWSDNVTASSSSSSSSSYTLYVGESFEKLIEAFDGDITDQVAILVDDSVGLPDGFELLPPAISGRDGGTANVASRVLSAIPSSSQTGLSFQVCLLALNSNSNPLGPNTKIRRCLSFTVLHPQLRWTADTPEEGSSLLAYPGCNVEVLVNVASLWYSVLFRYDKLLMDFQGVFSPWNGTLAGVSFAPLPSSPTPLPQLGPQPEFLHSAKFLYQPPPFLAGRKLKLCFLASDPWNISSISRCVILQLGSCKACIRAGQTLSSLALEYKTDWLQLWLTNPNIGNPNRIRSSIDVLSIGVPYTTRGGETVSGLAERFYLTANDVLESNTRPVLLLNPPSCSRFLLIRFLSPSLSP
ncbi:hypothetical protein GUITHDRAFT_136329 [Guillardia theta CCMP2712]|uniref:Fibronectin type-III domain-containing protein n=1 Tax=Guillardia theta (strain CCMP2712) TaxID=905079 RepID=L1JKZ2_GUITC|nr:hypothetical protein GUITHDRAFT_136329 [Guillardia theta CCMP2712]EKX49173.1 hypothetical protein GUITHDRAFT_136329 [Guillardia theta CCMP2712]|eukprot:XP_005836153.1 hypothetical protein GUITHDRAFT_136329 [Guillardia theta CCMP2712]